MSDVTDKGSGPDWTRTITVETEYQGDVIVEWAAEGDTISLCGMNGAIFFETCDVLEIAEAMIALTKTMKGQDDE